MFLSGKIRRNCCVLGNLSLVNCILYMLREGWGFWGSVFRWIYRRLVSGLGSFPLLFFSLQWAYYPAKNPQVRAGVGLLASVMYKHGLSFWSARRFGAYFEAVLFSGIFIELLGISMSRNVFHERRSNARTFVTPDQHPRKNLCRKYRYARLQRPRT